MVKIGFFTGIEIFRIHIMVSQNGYDCSIRKVLPQCPADIAQRGKHNGPVRGGVLDMRGVVPE
jgi:hypothetical protein